LVVDADEALIAPEDYRRVVEDNRKLRLEAYHESARQEVEKTKIIEATADLTMKVKLAKDDFYFMFDLIKDQAHEARNSRSYEYERITKQLVDKVRNYRDTMEDEISAYKSSIATQHDLADYRKQLKITEKELALIERLIDKTKDARKQSDVKYQESKRQKRRSRSRS